MKRKTSPVLVTLLVLFLAVILAGILMPIDLRGHGDSKANATKVSLSNVKQALLAFNEECGRYPTTVEGLDSLVKAPVPCPSGWHVYMDKLPTDGWGYPFYYVGPAPGGVNFDLYSGGEDGKDGTADDIHLRDLE